MRIGQIIDVLKAAAPVPKDKGSVMLRISQAEAQDKKKDPKQQDKEDQEDQKQQQKQKQARGFADQFLMEHIQTDHAALKKMSKSDIKQAHKQTFGNTHLEGRSKKALIQDILVNKHGLDKVAQALTEDEEEN